MRIKTIATAASLAFAAYAAPVLVYGFDLSFLAQSPARYFSDADMNMMEATVDKALDEAKDGESRTWRNDQTGSYGSVKVVKSFSADGRHCRRIELDNHAKEAAKWDARSLMDMCKIGDIWKILALPD
ncbi:MAG: RT0821/Lpp0805 family surface protein [Pseudomonadota bacterium]|nr:RT0821/Lpp0805 family surface protein [Pseudomonadota bacterium]